MARVTSWMFGAWLVAATALIAGSTPHASAQLDGCLNATFEVSEVEFGDTDLQPGNETRGQYEVSLMGDACQRSFTISAETDNETWSASSDTSTMELCVGPTCAITGGSETGQFNVTITAPDEAEAGAAANLAVTVVEDADDGGNQTVTKALSVLQVYAFDLSCLGTGPVEVPRGGSGSFLVEAMNQGNGHDNADLTAGAPDYLAVGFSSRFVHMMPGGMGMGMMPDMMDAMQPNVTVTAASDADRGEADVTITATSQGDPTVSASCTQSIIVTGAEDDEEESPNPGLVVSALILLGVAWARRRTA